MHAIMYIMYHCIVRNDDGEWSVGDVMTHPLNEYELKLTERRKQFPSEIITLNEFHQLTTNMLFTQIYNREMILTHYCLYYRLFT